MRRFVERHDIPRYELRDLNQLRIYVRHRDDISAIGMTKGSENQQGFL